jgi:hypothetical protein
MVEARRFLRYVLPGLLFASELTLFLWLSESSWTWAQTHFRPSTDSTEKVIAAAITALVASGGIGYLLATLNHILLTPVMFNYRPLLQTLIDRELISVVDHAGQSVVIHSSSPALNWTVVNAIWHARRESSQRIKGAEARTCRSLKKRAVFDNYYTGNSLILS